MGFPREESRAVSVDTAARFSRLIHRNGVSSLPFLKDSKEDQKRGDFSGEDPPCIAFVKLVTFVKQRAAYVGNAYALREKE